MWTCGCHFTSLLTVRCSLSIVCVNLKCLKNTSPVLRSRESGTVDLCGGRVELLTCVEVTWTCMEYNCFKSSYHGNTVEVVSK